MKERSKPVRTTNVEGRQCVDLVVRWGSQVRLKCAACTRYLPTPREDGHVQCKGCHMHYHHVNGDFYEVQDTGQLAAVGDG